MNITCSLSSGLKFLRLLKTASTSNLILKLNEMEANIERGCARSTKATPPPAPPPPPPPPPFWAARKPMMSVTNQEIAKYWRKKRVEEEDHLLAAIKAAARIRARNLTVKLNLCTLFFQHTLFDALIQSELFTYLYICMFVLPYGLSFNANHPQIRKS